MKKHIILFLSALSLPSFGEEEINHNLSFFINFTSIHTEEVIAERTTGKPSLADFVYFEEDDSLFLDLLRKVYYIDVPRYFDWKPFLYDDLKGDSIVPLLPHIDSSFVFLLPEGWELIAESDTTSIQLGGESITISTSKSLVSYNVAYGQRPPISRSLRQSGLPEDSLRKILPACAYLFSYPGENKSVSYPREVYDFRIEAVRPFKQGRYSGVRLIGCTPFRYESLSHALSFLNEVNIPLRLRRRTDMPDPDSINAAEDAETRRYLLRHSQDWGDSLELLYPETE